MSFYPENLSDYLFERVHDKIQYGNMRNTLLGRDSYLEKERIASRRIRPPMASGAFREFGGGR